jgi:hypothetical protein
MELTARSSVSHDVFAKPPRTFADSALVVGALCLGEGSIARHEARDHWRDELCRFERQQARFLGEQLGIGGKIAVDGDGQFDGDLHRLVVGDCRKFQLVISPSLIPDIARARDRD